MNWFRAKKTPKPKVVSRPAQHPDELPALLSLAVKATSYLEIGCRFGGTFNAMVRMMPVSSRAVAVDLPGGNWGADSEAELRRVVSNLREDGYDVHLFLGDSKSPQIIEAVGALGPFDVALIDGDHLYGGVKADWLNYGPMTGTAIFHDIAGEGLVKSPGLPMEVPQLWREIKASGLETREVVGRGSISGLGFVTPKP
jgi:hypothetical protein